MLYLPIMRIAHDGCEERAGTQADWVGGAFLCYFKQCGLGPSPIVSNFIFNSW